MLSQPGQPGSRQSGGRRGEERTLRLGFRPPTQSPLARSPLQLPFSEHYLANTSELTLSTQHLLPTSWAHRSTPHLMVTVTLRFISSFVKWREVQPPDRTA